MQETTTFCGQCRSRFDCTKYAVGSCSCTVKYCIFFLYSDIELDSTICVFLPNNKIMVWCTLKAFSDDKIKLAINNNFCRVEKIVGKRRKF